MPAPVSSRKTRKEPKFQLRPVATVAAQPVLALAVHVLPDQFEIILAANPSLARARRHQRGLRDLRERPRGRRGVGELEAVELLEVPVPVGDEVDRLAVGRGDASLERGRGRLRANVSRPRGEQDEEAHMRQ